MAFAQAYERQVALLIRVMPLVMEEPDFALKGGTAINLFIRDLPRLSVDIDLTYLPIRDRAASLAGIDVAMLAIAARIEARIPGVRVNTSRLQPDNVVTKLVVRVDGVQIKIEVTPVLRGCVFEPEPREVSPSVEDRFGFATARVVSFPDLYAGKIVAALDRQHPRDLFDVRDLLAAEGVDARLRAAFIVYMISHPRPFGEVLAPTRKDIAEEYRLGFDGMTDAPVPIEALLDAREAIIATMVGGMPESHRRFLLGFKRGEPDWDLLGLPHIAELPAVRWKLQNLRSISDDRRAGLLANLERAIESGGQAAPPR
jgi:predicted nucleotidyltransferase component of viral defense system